MKYSRSPWKQFLQRIQEVPTSEWRVNQNGGVIKCRKHTDLVMKALKETARDTGHIALVIYLSAACK